MQLRALLFLSALSITASHAQTDDIKDVNIYVSLDGDDRNPGILTKPKKTVDGALETLRDFRFQGVITPDIPVNLWIRGGRYPVEQTIHLRSEDSGTKETPFRISAYKDEKVIFDGRQPIDKNLFKVASAPADLSRLSKKGHGKILVARIDDPVTLSRIKDPSLNLSWGDQLLQPARFPDAGFMMANSVHSAGQVGKTGTDDAPVGAAVTLTPRFPAEWAEEITAGENNRLSGYISAMWLKQDFIISSASGSRLQLRDGLRYKPKTGQLVRAYLKHVLPALDRPGEWYFDLKTRQLFLWPPFDLKENEIVGYWSGARVFELSGSAHVSVEKLIFENLDTGNTADAAFNISGGTGNRAAGCTFRNIGPKMLAYNILSGTHNGLQSCDIYDVQNAGRLYGGKASHDQIEHANNYIQNCHFTQVHALDFYGKVSGINGAGNIFRNNLCHNHNGQIVTMEGVDHLVELNEVFNTGVEEGDGGAFYQGSMFYSWGNVFRHNFFHHIMCIPGLYSRAAIFADDGDAGDEMYGNVFYKAADSIKSNNGPGHYIHGNLFIDGIQPVLVLAGNGKGKWGAVINRLKRNPTENTKNNLVGRGLNVMGRPGWSDGLDPNQWPDAVSPFWRERYPRLDALLNDWGRRKSFDVVCKVENNFAFDWAKDDPWRLPSVTEARNNRNRSLSIFQNPKVLDFSYRGGRKPAWAPEIPFEKIGLYKDEFRTKMPDKNAYRKEAADYWKKHASAAPPNYDPKLVNERAYFNTGKMLRKHMK